MSETTSVKSMKIDNDVTQKGTQVQGKKASKAMPCPHLCTLIPTDVPHPDQTQHILHPRKDVFVLKVAKVGAQGDRRCKMELELVTPKGPEKKLLMRYDTKDAQCEPCPCSCCCAPKSGKKKKKKKCI